MRSANQNWSLCAAHTANSYGSVGIHTRRSGRLAVELNVTFGDQRYSRLTRAEPPFWRQVWSPGIAANAVPNCVLWVHPERVQLRAMRAADDDRAMWDTMERLWPDTVARAGRLPEGALRLWVDDQWSFRREAASSGRRH